MLLAEHLVARTRFGDRSLLQSVRANWLWSHISRVFPNALSLVLMPDHLHLVVPAGRQPRLKRLLTSFARRFAVRFDLPAPVPVHSAAICSRIIRYGYLNPVRAGLVDDPWAWLWSSARDLVGACHPIWTPRRRVSEATQLHARVAVRRLTTTADLKVATPISRECHIANFDDIVLAAAAATRSSPTPLLHSRGGQRLITQTAFAAGLSRTAPLAEFLGTHPSTIWRQRQTPHPALEASLLCLSDPRLTTSLRSRRKLAV